MGQEGTSHRGKCTSVLDAAPQSHAAIISGQVPAKTKMTGQRGDTAMQTQARCMPRGAVSTCLSTLCLLSVHHGGQEKHQGFVELICCSQYVSRDATEALVKIQLHPERCQADEHPDAHAAQTAKEQRAPQG